MRYLKNWYVLLLCLLLIPTSHAATPAEFQDCVLIGFTTDPDSNTRLYSVQVGQNTFVLKPTISGKKTAGESAMVIGTLGYGALFVRNKASLYNQLPGAHVEIRPSGDNYEVKAGRKSTLYRLVQTQ